MNGPRLMDKGLPHNFFAFTAPGTGEIAWDNMSICRTCFGLHGEWTLRGSPQTVIFYERCRCESAVPEGRQSHPANWDTGIAVQLCCAAILLPGGSRWSVWFCEPCKVMVGALHEEVHAVVFPIGPHSLQAGLGIRGGAPITDQQIKSFVASLGDFRQRMDLVHEWAALSTQANIRALDLAGNSDVPLSQFLGRLVERGVDRAQKFAGMAIFCGVGGSLIGDIIEHGTRPYPMALADPEHRKLMKQRETGSKDLETTTPQVNGWEEALRAYARRRDVPKKEPDAKYRDLIYGESPDGNLVFMERSKALENIAFCAAANWGDFRKTAPTLYEEALEFLGMDEETAPADDNKLDHGELSAGGNFPYFPPRLMLDFIPELVQQRYGKVEWTDNGEMLELDPAREPEIVAALLSQGFSCERDQALVDTLYQ